MTKNKKEEKKGAGAASSAGAVQRGAQVLSHMPEITVRGAVQHGLMATVAHFFSTGVGMLALTAMVAGASFFSLWDLNRQKEEAMAKRRAAATFNQGTYHSPARTVQSDTRANGDSLSFLAAANQGAAEQNSPAAQAGDASAQASQAAPAQQSNDIPNQGSADAAAQAQAAATQAISGNHFGQLSTGLGKGNGLAGGSGMSGGVGRQFDHKTMLAQLPDAGHGSFGTQNAAATSAGVRRSAVGGGSGGGKGAMGQLRFASGTSQGGAGAASSTSAAYQAAKGFEGNTGAAGSAGNPIGGTGDTQGAANQVSGAGLDHGSPVSNSSSPNSNGNNVPSAGPGTDVTPWGSMANMAEMLTMLAGALLIIASFMGWHPTPATHILIRVLAGIVIALGAVVTMIGIALMTMYGQTAQGTIFTAVGAVLTAMAILEISSFGTNLANKVPIEIMGTVVGAGAPILGELGVKAGSNSTSSQSSSGSQGGDRVHQDVQRMKGPNS